MPAQSMRFEERFSTRAFLLGLCVVIGVYLLLFGALAALQENTMASLEERLTSHTAVIEYIQTGPAPIAPIADVHGPMQDTLAEEDKVAPPEPEHETPPPATADEIAGVLHDNQATALSVSPDIGLYEETPHGVLPIAASGKTPFKAYRKPFTLNRDKPALAVAVLDYGLSAPLAEEMLKQLPPSISLILTPYAADPDHWQLAARESGHEIWLQLMTETKNFPLEDPGAKALMTNVSLKENQQRFYWTLGRTTGYAGIAAFTDKTLENSGPMFETIAQDIFKRGLAYFELSSDRYSFFEPFAVNSAQPSTHSQVSITDLSPESPELANINKFIADNGGAVAIIKPTPANIQNLKAWLASMQEKGIEIVPVSAIAALSTESP